MAFLWRFLFGNHVTDPVEACGHSPATSEDPHSANYSEDLVKPAKRLGWVPSNAVFSGHESLAVAAVKDRIRGRFERGTLRFSLSFRNRPRSRTRLLLANFRPYGSSGFADCGSGTESCAGYCFLGFDFLCLLT